MPKQSRPFMPRSAHHPFFPLDDAGTPLFFVRASLPADCVLEQVVSLFYSAQALLSQCAEQGGYDEPCAQLAYSADYLLDMAYAGLTSALIGLARSTGSDRDECGPRTACQHFYQLSKSGGLNRDGDPLFGVRAGLPVGSVLEQAICYVSAAQSLANLIGEKSERGEPWAQFAYSADYLLDMAKACVNAVLGGLARDCAAAIDEAEGARV